MKLFTKQEIQSLEHAATLSGVSFPHLMDQAGRALASLTASRLAPLPGKQITLLCGCGNNGGDGFVCARILASQGAHCTVLLTQGEPKTDLARAAFLHMPNTVAVLCTAHQPEESRQALLSAACILDCVFGFSFHGTLSGDSAQYLALANTLPALRIACDLPSGAECDTACVSENTFSAHITVALSALKPAHCSYPAKAYCGEVITAPTGIPAHLLAEAPATHFQPDKHSLLLPSALDPQANKGTLGRLLLVCGSFGMAGACIMAAKGALRCGVGLLHIAIDARAYPILAAAVPQAVFTVLDFTAPTWPDSLRPALEACTACVIGSGLGSDAEKLCPPVFAYFQNQSKPLLADADALNYCARTPGALESIGAPLVVTPHPGEMGRLTGLTPQEVQAARLPLARDFAARTSAITVLKGAGTVITDGARTAINPTGSWGMAKGGSGDVLAGMIGSLLAQGMEAFPAAVLGAYLHGLAGDICRDRFTARAMLPTDLPEALPEAWKELLSST